jgi:hypothetical protein
MYTMCALTSRMCVCVCLCVAKEALKDPQLYEFLPNLLLTQYLIYYILGLAKEALKDPQLSKDDKEKRLQELGFCGDEGDEGKLKNRLNDFHRKKLDSELIAGNFRKGAAIVFVLDMAVTDDECRRVQECLWAMPTFGHVIGSMDLRKCPATQKTFAKEGGGLFGGGAGGLFGGGVGDAAAARCYLCGFLYDVGQLDVLAESRLPHFGYEGLV